MQKLPPRSLSPALMTGLDGEPSPDTPWTHLRRGAAHRLRRLGKEERRRLMLPAIPVSSYARTVPGPASLGSDFTATLKSVIIDFDRLLRYEGKSEERPPGLPLLRRRSHHLTTSTVNLRGVGGDQDGVGVGVEIGMGWGWGWGGDGVGVGAP